MSYPTWCCQKCGESIGWIGRFLFPTAHRCRPPAGAPSKPRPWPAYPCCGADPSHGHRVDCLERPLRAGERE